ncbi:MAG: Ig-like domain-containing protein, partial [Saccharofermentans sp.]|nr:Ig-like domain-containing protein [Saccharofermentans sp.]
TAAGGTVTVGAGGVVTYTPALHYNGPDSFYYIVDNGNADPEHRYSAATLVTIIVISDDDPPVAEDITLPAFYEDTVPEPFDLTTITSDPDLLDVNSTESLTYSLEGEPVVREKNAVDMSDIGSWVTITPDGQLFFNPPAGFNGIYEVTYRVTDSRGLFDTGVVTFEVLPTEDDPIAVDDEATVDEDDYVVIHVLDNDTDDPDSNPLWNLNVPARNDYSLTVDPDLVTEPLHGTAVVNADNTITYTPDADYNGEDSFEYRIVNLDGNSATAWVTVTVNVAADKPTANEDSFDIYENSSDNQLDVIDNDYDKDSDPDYNSDLGNINTERLRIDSVTQPAHGTVTIVTVNGEDYVVYVPDANYNGPDSFTYTAVNEDGTVSEPATVSVNVIAVNSDPTANSDEVTTLEDEAVVLHPIENDTDVDYDPELNVVPDSYDLSIVPDSFSGNEPGSTIEYDPETDTLTYTPAPGYVGVDEFTYTLSDGNGGTATGTVKVTVLLGTYYLEIDPDSIDYADLNQDYPEAPAAQTVTVTNMGNKPLNISVSELESFEIIGEIPEVLMPGESFTVEIAPMLGLEPGAYNETFVVTATEGPVVECGLSFTVNEVFDIVSTVEDGGTINYELTNTVQAGTTITYIFTPDEGYEVLDVIIDGVSVGPVSSYTFENVSAAHTIQVRWSEVLGSMRDEQQSQNSANSSGGRTISISATGEAAIAVTTLIGSGAIHLGASLFIVAFRNRKKEEDDQNE